MNKGDLVLFKGKHIISRVIEFFTGEFSHAAIVSSVGDEYVVLTEALADGIVQHHLQRDVISESGEVWHYPIREAYRKGFNTQKFDRFILRTLGDKYDYIGALAAGINVLTGWKPKTHKGRYFCSEYCTLALIEAGIVNTALPAEITPTLLTTFNAIDYGVRLK